MIRWISALSALLLLVAASGCEGEDGKAMGIEGGPCYGNGTCDGGLECRYGVCVNPSTAADVVQGTDPGGTTDYGTTTDPGSGGCTTNCGEMVTVSGGSFWQGCNAEVENACDSNEKPYHQVTVPAFEIDEYEVTVGLYGDCVDTGSCSVPDTGTYCNWGVSGREGHPVNCITWYQAREYCAWAGKRLCSESEWEKASRGTDGRKYPWGNEEATCEYCVMDDGGNGCGEDSTWPVGSKPAGASPCGAMDMSGNVWEWVEDDWHGSYNEAPTDGSAWVEDPRASNRVERGGSFYGYDYGLRSSDRDYYDPADVSDTVGARCCRSK